MGCCASAPATSGDHAAAAAAHAAPAAAEAGALPQQWQERVQLCAESMRANGGRLIVYGVLQRANVRNRNGRIYPKAILEREAAAYYRGPVQAGSAYGEADHPDHTSQRFRMLTQANISHRVLDYHWEADALVGAVEILSTPAGRMVLDLYRAGYALGMSSRAWASLMLDRKNVYIHDDMELIAFDFVSDPSTAGAYLLPVPGPYESSLAMAAALERLAGVEGARGPPVPSIYADAGPRSKGRLVPFE